MRVYFWLSVSQSTNLQLPLIFKDGTKTCQVVRCTRLLYQASIPALETLVRALLWGGLRWWLVRLVSPARHETKELNSEAIKILVLCSCGAVVLTPSWRMVWQYSFIVCPVDGRRELPWLCILCSSITMVPSVEISMLVFYMCKLNTLTMETTGIQLNGLSTNLDKPCKSSQALFDSALTVLRAPTKPACNRIMS